jgi:hypothetical protein
MTRLLAVRACRICVGWGIVALSALLFSASPATAATTYTVAGTADDAGGTCTGTVCTSLRAAVANVPAGATIQLSSGIYKLNGVLLIGQSETIVGVSPSQTTIQQTKPGDGVIEDSTGALSLTRLAITGGTKQGVFGQDQAAGGIFAAGTDLTLDHVSVTGNTATGSTGAAGSHRPGGTAVGAIQIDGATTTLTISNSSITNNVATGGTGAAGGGSGNGQGGGTAYAAIDDTSTPVTITNSVISGNTATGGTGGAASLSPWAGGLAGQADGALGIIGKSGTTSVISGSTIAQNTITGGQGGNGTSGAKGGNGNSVFGALDAGGNTVLVTSSTISGNHATLSLGGTGTPAGQNGFVEGGGVAFDGVMLALVNSTVTGNAVASTGEGGGLAVDGGSLVLGSDTIFGNSAPQGGNLSLSGVTFTLADTIIAGGVQSASGPTSASCSLDTVSETDLGHNLENTTPSQCGLSPSNSDLIGTGPQLASPAANGGPTQTMALGGASPALHAGGTCTDVSQPGAVPLTVDQRGLPRATPCDIGAFEHQPVTQVSPPSISGNPAFGSTLTCSPGTWSGDGVGFVYQWARSGAAIRGTTASRYVVGAADFGTQLSCTVTAVGTYGRVGTVATLTMPQDCNCTPKLTKLAQTHRRWRRGNALAHLSAARPPVGTTFSFRLDRAATVKLSFTRTSTGRIVRRRCVPLTRANRHAKACTVTKTAGTMTFRAHAGLNRIAFQGRLNRRQRLATGSYIVGVSAALTGGPSSRTATLRFTVSG